MYSKGDKRMNRTKIEWADFTWNVMTGCLHGCDYCYARRIVKRFPHIYPQGFEPTFHESRLAQPASVKRPSRVFVCSMADLFGDWVPTSQISAVVEACAAAPWHDYMFLTKNSRRYADLYHADLPALRPLFAGTNMWLGVTATGSSMSEGVYWAGRGWVVDKLPAHTNLFLSVEPLLGPVHIPQEGIDWVIVGPQTGPGAVKPEPAWVDHVADQCTAAGIPLFMKVALYGKRFAVVDTDEPMLYHEIMERAAAEYKAKGGCQHGG